MKTSCYSLVQCCFADVVDIVRLVELDDLFPSHRNFFRRGGCLKFHCATCHRFAFLLSLLPLNPSIVFVASSLPFLLHPYLYLSLGKDSLRYLWVFLNAAASFPLRSLLSCAQQSSGKCSKVTGGNFCLKKQQQWRSWCGWTQLVLNHPERSGLKIV